MCLKLFPVFLTAHVQHGMIILTKYIYFDQRKIQNQNVIAPIMCLQYFNEQNKGNQRVLIVK